MDAMSLIKGLQRMPAASRLGDVAAGHICSKLN
jgi:hypothetical protein